MTDSVKIREYWNGVGGQGWVDLQTVIDAMFAPFTDLLLADCGAKRLRRVLDVGCGAGTTTLAAARRVGTSGQSVGIDISEPLIGAARSAAGRESIAANFIVGDAETYAFEPAHFDLVISRFGVLFFDDPARAFANLRGATRDRGLLRFVSWRSPSDNLFYSTAVQAAASIIPNVSAHQADEPGPFALADRNRILHVLEKSGWGAIDVQPVDITCAMPEPALPRYIMRMGPIARALRETDERTQRQVVETVRAALDVYVHGAEVRFPAACWMVCAGSRIAASTAPA